MTPRPVLTPKTINTFATFVQNLLDHDSLIRRLLRGLGWVTLTPLIMLRKLPQVFAAGALLLLAYSILGTGGLVLLLVLPLITWVMWRLAHPDSAEQVAAYVRGRWRYRRIYRKHWPTIAAACGLSIPGAFGRQVAPELIGVTAYPAADALHVRLLAGQSPADYADRADALAHAFGASQVRVRSDQPGTVTLLFSTGDMLTDPIPAMTLDAQDVDFEALPVGFTEDGSPYRLRLLYSHVLTAGATGSGKGSALWSTVRALAPAVPSGVVELWGADPKGGIELAMGRALFSRFTADDEPGDMVQLVTEAADLVRARSKRLRGHSRKHVPTADEPFVVLIIDELAYLTDYQDDIKLKHQFNKALKVILSQGRAAGISVLAFVVQDPRKSVVDAHNLFPAKIALRLDTASEVEMVLGKDAWEHGAHAEAIPESLPGTGYVLVDGDPTPVRIRFTWVTDDDIRATARDYPAPPPAPPRHGFTVVTDTDDQDDDTTGEVA
ncbi:FtsK/SpoIIIE domain-containing protein [Jiangella rhizosphaerae]|uniref:Cell division protein FtsK n=1 Tax=Jiangella rhizosphaerae TaxID=2293569 RepID=A0A418KGJ1_9ACTN|nr:FtsK/SpoIIIE domain-containing protein [Jiangella rhizosphaerae]RIQ11125.1 cell division protein FtsK [Jiangella rhizosphaerae]